MLGSVFWAATCARQYRLRSTSGAEPGQGRLLPPRGSLCMSRGAPSIRSPTLNVSEHACWSSDEVGVDRSAHCDNDAGVDLDRQEELAVHLL